MKQKKNSWLRVFAICLVGGLLLVVLSLQLQESSETSSQEMSSSSQIIESEFITFYGIDTDEVLLNPGKGLVLRSYPDSTFDPAFLDKIAIGYTRFDWSEIEPEEGQYRWDIIDDYISAYHALGKEFAFGVMNANSSADKMYVTPEWVFEAGAEGRAISLYHDWTGERVYFDQMIPNWSDPIFIEKMKNFVKALGERYDGHPDVPYIDIRSFGNWGEQHYYEIEEAGWEYITPEMFQQDYLQPYLDAFPNTLLVNSGREKRYAEVYQWAVEQGMSMRRDGIMYFYDGSECMDVYGKAPAIYELAYGYSDLVEMGLWDEEKLMEALEAGKPSYLQVSQEMYQSDPAFFDAVANLLGYHFRLKTVTYPHTLSVGEPCEMTFTFSNDGLTPLYEPALVYLGVLDEDGNLLRRYLTQMDPHDWMPDETATHRVSIYLEGLEPGSYRLAVGLYRQPEDENPTYLLGTSGGTEDKWYPFGNLVLTD